MKAIRRLPRCTEKGCPWRWRTGDDRLCPDHDGNQGAIIEIERLMRRDDLAACDE